MKLWNHIVRDGCLALDRHKWRLLGEAFASGCLMAQDGGGGEFVSMLSYLLEFS